MEQDLIPHLFRTEFARITATLCRTFGLRHIETAEDIAGDVFLAALRTWPYRGVPENPTGWLYTVAANKARNLLARDQAFRERVLPAARLSEPASSFLQERDPMDEQLQMMFALCHPLIPGDAQVALCLKVLCGFSVDEIAAAFLSGRDAIEKRLYRARERIRTAGIELEFPPEGELPSRLDGVLTALYLLFNEGCYSESSDHVIRRDLCLDAIRLTHLLAEDRRTATPRVYALLALMCFHASRLEARHRNGELVLYADQDVTRWNHDLIARGAGFLRQASGGPALSPYHLEAAIAWWHTHHEDTAEKWENILSLYNYLLRIRYSTVAALNRTYALAKARGNDMAIREAEALGLTDNPYYFALLSELYGDRDVEKARRFLVEAIALARTAGDRRALEQKLARMDANGTSR